MSATGYLDACGFIPASSGTGNFVVSTNVTGYQTPASAGAVNSTVYSYRAESADKSQWEEGYGAYTVSTTTLVRTTITANSSGGTSAINFSAAPNVFIVAASADLQNASLLTSGTLPNARLTPGQFPGTATNDNANSGNIGEYVSASVASGAAISLTSGSSVNMTSISLTAGDWDVSGIILFVGGSGAAFNRGNASISQTNGTLDATTGAAETIINLGGVILYSYYGTQSLTVGPVRISLSATTTIYLVTAAGFSGGTVTAYGSISARRIR